MFAAAVRTALTIFMYPVQRQRLPESAQRISSSVGSGLASSSATEVIIMPGVQKPHCRPCSSVKAAWMGWSVAALLQPLDRADLAAIGLHGEGRTRLDRDAVQQDGAHAAARRVAADVRAGESKFLSQESGRAAAVARHRPQ